MKKIFIIALVCLFALSSVFAGGGKEEAKTTENQSYVKQVIAQAETMSFDEICKKAIEETKGQSVFGVGNSSRGKSAFPLLVEYLKTIDPTYDVKFEWQQPKNNNIFGQLAADSAKTQGTFFAVLIQDGNQIESKMVQTGILDTYIPLEWAEANGYKPGEYKGYLPLQTLNKVFMYNCTGSKTYSNFWDFVAPGEHGLFMDIDSEVVGKNFLYMLTAPQYAKEVKAAYDALPSSKQGLYKATIDSLADEAKGLGLDENGKYALAWIKLWVESYNAQTDDGPICNTLVDKSATDQFGLLVYSKLRSVQESSSVSKNNIKVAAYDDGYTGLGGYGYCHYMFVPDNSPYPWTACAFIAYITEFVDGFSAWGKDIGGYSSNPKLAADNEVKYQHMTGGNDENGNVKFAALNDKGYDWWAPRLVIEDPEYCASVSFTVGSWIDMLSKYSGK